MLATFAMRAPRDVYPKFLETHERAVALGGLRPELRCNRAHGLHLFEHRPRQAEAEFQQTIAEKPACTTAHVRMALLYATLGDLDQALAAVTAANRIDPLLPTVRPAEVNVRVWRREFDAAVAVGTSAIELHPYLSISRANYALALELSNRRDDALAQYQLGSVMSGDLPWMRAYEGACLAQLARRDEAGAILDELTHRRATEYVDALSVAVLREALGDRDAALDELERAYEERSASLYSLGVDPRMDPFRQETRFARVRAALQALHQSHEVRQ
jgi:tetratricopeptide (TPR) repeat protein